MATFSFIFRVGCVLLSVCATIWPIYLFNSDEDSLEIEFKDLHSSKNTPYPLIRLCFDRSMFNEHNNSLTTSQLKDGLDTGTLYIADYISYIVIVHANKTHAKTARNGIKKLVTIIQHKGTFSHIILQRFQSTDCIDIGIPFTENKGIQAISVSIKKDVFKEDAVPTRNEIMSGTRKLTIGMSDSFSSFRLPSHGSREVLFDKQLNRTCSGIAFIVNGMEVLQHRNKPSSPCIDYDSHGIYERMHQTTNDLGCIPSEWEIPSTLPYCQENKQNSSTEPMFQDFKKSLEQTNPCRSIQDVQIEYNLEDSMDGCKNDNKTLQITAVYNGFLYKEIRMVRSFTVWNLLSSLGVIIGLFYGASLIQVPKFIKALRRRKKGYNPTNSVNQQMSFDQDIDMIQTQRSEPSEERKNAKKEIAIMKAQIMRLLMNLDKKEYEAVV